MKIFFRLSINSQALDIVYNPSAFKVIKDFFITTQKKKESGLATAALLTSAAKRRYVSHS